MRYIALGPIHSLVSLLRVRDPIDEVSEAKVYFSACEYPETEGPGEGKKARNALNLDVTSKDLHALFKLLSRTKHIGQRQVLEVRAEFKHLLDRPPSSVRNL